MVCPLHTKISRGFLQNEESLTRLLGNGSRRMQNWQKSEISRKLGKLMQSRIIPGNQSRELKGTCKTLAHQAFSATHHPWFLRNQLGFHRAKLRQQTSTCPKDKSWFVLWKFLRATSPKVLCSCALALSEPMNSTLADHLLRIDSQLTDHF